jgi:hypothetical protein
MKPSNLLLAFLLCPFIGTSAFLAPPKNMEMIRANNGEPRIRDSTEKIHLLDGKLSFLIPTSPYTFHSSNFNQFCRKNATENSNTGMDSFRRKK